MTTLQSLAAWLETTNIALFVRESAYGFPIVVGIHISGLMLSLGLMVWFDLRLLGLVWTTTPVSMVYRRIIPWAGTGFAVMFISGGILFTSYATDAIVNTAFRVKLLAIAVAGVNALIYHLRTERRGQWDAEPRPPAAARAAGLISIFAWSVVLFSGRIISYTMF
jgi:hypothetical protein